MKIRSGVEHFQARVYPRHRDHFAGLADGQSPQALFITCSDSRIDPALLTQSRPGDIFVLRNAGNLVPPAAAGPGAEAAAVEYAVRALKVEHIVVCGHSRCGAMAGLLQPDSLSDLPSVRSWLSHAEPVLPRIEPGLDTEARLLRTVELNVLQQIEHLRSHAPVREAEAEGRLQIHGWVYRMVRGQVLAHHAGRGRFEPLAADLPVDRATGAAG